MALPFCSCLLLLCWGFLLLVYKKDLPKALPPITINHARPGAYIVQYGASDHKARLHSF